jgi:hypothetical protein
MSPFAGYNAYFGVEIHPLTARKKYAICTLGPKPPMMGISAAHLRFSLTVKKGSKA